MISIQCHDPAYHAEAGCETFGFWFAIYDHADKPVVTAGLDEELRTLTDFLAAAAVHLRATPADVRALVEEFALAGADDDSARLIKQAFAT